MCCLIRKVKLNISLKQVIIEQIVVNNKQKRACIRQNKMFNPPQIYFTDQRLNNGQQTSDNSSISNFKYLFKQFLYQFDEDHVKIYMKEISRMINEHKYFITLKLSHIKAENQTLYELFILDPLEKLRIMQGALKELLIEKRNQFPPYDDKYSWQIILISDDSPKIIRSIGSSDVQKLLVIQGIIISSTKPFIKASKLKLKCRDCDSIKFVDVNPGQNPYVPSACFGGIRNNKKCSLDPFVAMPDSQVMDVQHLKIQQNPQQIPSGQIARTYQLIADRYNVGKCVPGDRVRITGIMIIGDARGQIISKGSIYVTGIEKTRERTSFQYTNQQEENFKKMAKDPRLYEKIQKSIAPGIYGNEEIKKAIACMLFGGSRKFLPDKTILRGDINILLLGDPSTAKSQFLKFVQKTASIAVYTSGKGSSAAGLTASITKDMATGEFQIQGGALVLADGGIVCIDQFDKMRPQDRVAIHQAMQQQTISVAKAGITTRLNSRTSILAAANPIHGRISNSTQINNQIQLQTTILSRFDCLFIVRDINTHQNNTRIADHVLGLHQGKIMAKEVDQDAVPFDDLKRYISYARNKIKPRLTQQAAEKLQAIYVEDRKKSQQHKSNKNRSIPITVRQLQAIIRLSQSLSKMKLSSQVTKDQVDEAHYLFEISTMKTIEGGQFGIEIPSSRIAEIQKVEDLIKKRLPVGNAVSIKDLVDKFGMKHGEDLVHYAISNMIKNQELRQVKGNFQVIRDK